MPIVEKQLKDLCNMIEIIVWLIRVSSDNNVFLLKKNTKTSYEYTLVGGHVEKGESLKHVLTREVMEEVGVKVNPNDLMLTTIIARKLDDKHKIHFFFYTKSWEGTPYNKEPNIHLTGEWYPLNHLSTNIGPLAKRGVESLNNNKNFYEYGWEEK
ncbi:NUDIX domain-containing protein [Rickettsia endosymbiont of Halotydeus destructor]|uniref:NUDIX domain-containing protein n=1 Tax=Rickettsia endosymbiont of Halotydeus destructor TaxID=2996754 RepID=UPI003BAE6FCC